MPASLIRRAVSFADRIALREPRGDHSYAALVAASARCARALLGESGDLGAERVAYLVPPGFDNVVTQWAIWRAGGVAVPLAVSHPPAELARLLEDADPVRLVADPLFQEAADAALAAARASERNPPIEVITPQDLGEIGGAASQALPTVESSRRALMVYTSGTTGRPKGVVTTHANIEAQITTLVDAWEWTPDDHILHVLPLHHIHGIINALSCALWSGACCEFAAPQLQTIWERLASGEVSVFMGVPTIYQRLISAWEQADDETRRRWSTGARRARLMVSGSAALPVDTLERWERITGQRLLERYGMTEIGMALGNPLHGERRAGAVGHPFAGVEARIVSDTGGTVEAGEQGEIQVRGPQVFLEYWERPDETRAAFTADAWFRTGDEAVVEDGCWRIAGRQSVDIIKSGGYKVSALEIESILRQHPAVGDVAVVGVPDEEWGERVCAAVVAMPGCETSEEALRAWCKQQLAPYKVPRQLRITEELPRNAMGKVVKPALRATFRDAHCKP